MKKLIPILVFLFASLGVYGQNWNPLNPGVKRYFTNDNHYLRGMRIDSITASGNKLIYWPFKSTRNGYYNVQWFIDPIGSWLGEGIVKRTDGTFFFPNYWDDTIVIKPNAQPGDSWLFYHDTSTIYYVATLTSSDTMSILGTPDSIKRILVNVFDNGVPVVTDSFDNVEIILSKNHGFYQTMNLYMFPYHAPGESNVFDDYYLLGSMQGFGGWYFGSSSSPGPTNSLFRLIDYVNPTPAEMFNWSVGDIMEYTGCDWQLSGSPFNCYKPEWFYLDTVVAKNIVSGGVEYILNGWYAPLDTLIFTHAYYDLIPHTDTIFVANSGTFFNASLMPEEFDGGSYNTQWLNYYIPNDIGCTTGAVYYKTWNQPSISLVQAFNLYKTGLGLQRYGRYDGQDPSVWSNELIYYVRNGIACGVFNVPDTSDYNVVSVGEVREKNITIYPNPASETLTIETSLSRYKLSLINTIGQVVYNRGECDNKQVVDVRAFPAGVYQLRIETAGHEVINRKLIIQR